MPSRFAVVAAVLAAACACSGFAARAQEPSKAAVAAAREVLVIKGATQMLNPLPHGVIESVKDSFIPTNPNLTRELNDIAQALHKEYDVKRGELLDEMAAIYARHFTEQELKELVVFFKTPLGQKWAKDEPAAIEEGLRDAKQWTETFSNTVMARFRTEMQKKGHTL